MTTLNHPQLGSKRIAALFKMKTADYAEIAEKETTRGRQQSARIREIRGEIFL